jgi:FkbM family methyltransferase
MQRNQLKWAVLSFLRRGGWDVRRFDAFRTLEDYLSYILFPYLGVDCVLDVGAREGEFAQSLRNSGYRGHIVSFEPVSASFKILQARASADPKWHVRNVALGSEEGVAEINVMRGTNYSSLRSPQTTGAEDFQDFGNVVDHTETVRVRRLDGMFAEATGPVRNPRVFLKMDTQGWDLEVFKGAGTSLDHVVGLQSEMSIRPLYHDMPDFRTALSTYEAGGFVVSGVYAVGRDTHLRMAEFDCVMLRAETAASAPKSDVHQVHAGRLA